MEPVIETEVQPKKRPTVRRLVILVAIGLLGVLGMAKLGPRLLLPSAPPQHAVQEAAPEVPAAPETPPTFNPPADAPAQPIPETPAEAPKPAEAAAADLSVLTLRMLDAQLKNHERQLEALKAEQDAAWKTVALPNAYDRLKDAARSGKPFTQELAHMQELAGASEEAAQALKPIETLAVQGIPQLPQLKAHFDAAVRGALTPAISAQDGFFTRLRANFSQLIVVRKLGERPGTEPDAVIARAEAALARDDIANAANEIQTLTGQPARAYVNWLAEARAYLALGPTLAALKNSILATERGHAEAPVPAAERAE